MRNTVKPKLFLFLVFPILLLLGCADPEDDAGEGGVIGTGIILKGTVTDVRLFANNTLLIKSRSGEVSRAVIDEAGAYRAPNIAGSPPYLLRADLGNDEFRYGIAFDNQIANVHSYTDVVMRNWFASGNGDIDFEFEQSALTTTLPSRVQFQNNADVFFSLVSLVLESYQLSGDQLLFGDYDARNNNDGIHTFLLDNPMFIQNDTVALVITDPISQAQTTTKSTFSVFELASDADTEPPKEPEAVRALPSATNEIVVVWEAALDNRGVAGYDVYREGELIATTPYPVFIDTGLEPDLLYTYEVVSIDASNNRSAPSTPTTSGTLEEPDDVAPPAPVQLMVSPKVGRMDMLWGQSDIGDVVGFEIYRGRDNDAVDFLTTVTSSVHTDVTVESGVNYCYQIVALDAAGNESLRSDEVCESAVGDTVARTTTEPTTQVLPQAGLNIPDVENLVCEDELVSVSIESIITVEAGCYLLDESIEVRNGGHLNLNPGVVLKFGAGTRLRVNEGGSFTSEGTKAAPVVLSALDPTPGYWVGVEFQDSNSSRNKLVNTVVEFAAGGSDAAAVLVNAGSNGISRVDISGSVIRECAGTGVLATDDTSNLSRLDGSVITKCETPLVVRIDGLVGVTSRNSFTGNLNDWVDMGSGNVRSDLRLDDLGVPYASGRLLVIDANLSLGAGVEIQFREGSEMIIAGSFSAEGTEANPVILTGTLDEPGHWQGVMVRGKARFNSSEIRYAGSARNDSTTVDSSIMISGGSVDVNDLTISNSSAYALLINNTGELSSVNELSMLNNRRLIKFPITNISELGQSVFFENNEVSEIVLTSNGSINEGIDIVNLSVPYVLTGTVNMQKGILRVYEGVRVLFDDLAEIYVSGESALHVIGSEASPVLLSAKTAVAGSWGGLRFRSSDSVSRISHAVIEYAGGGTTTGAALVELNCNFDSQLYIENSVLQYSSGYGISLTDNEGCNLELGENLTFRRNRNGDIFVP